MCVKIVRLLHIVKKKNVTPNVHVRHRQKNTEHGLSICLTILEGDEGEGGGEGRGVSYLSGCSASS